jgi:NAD(P)-dependent dehydrogenase (short-subunit alcohol dehydrogenase family)
MDLGVGGRSYLITGGTDGLGLALARRLTEEGATVAVCGRDAVRLDRARELLGPTAHLAACDVTDAAQMARFVESTQTALGGLDGVVSNAGQSSAAAIEKSTDEKWQNDFELKVLAAVRLARLCTPALVARGGSFLSVLSVTAKAPGAGSTPTAASRAAGLALIKALAAELGPQGVRANAILIGLIESGQWERLAERSTMPVEDLYRRLAEGQKIPLGRVGRSEEFADLAAFVLSPRASYLTGVGINLDGGLSPVT